MNRSGSIALSTLIGVVLMYLILLGVAIAFSGQVLETIGSTKNSSPPLIMVILGTLFPLILLIAIGTQIVRLISQFRSGKQGVRFKVRIILFLSAMTLLSTVPQALLFGTYLTGMMKTELIEQTKKALESSVKLSTDQGDEIQRSFIALGKEPLLGLWYLPDSYVASWNRLQAFTNAPTYIELFSNSVNPIRVWTEGHLNEGTSFDPPDRTNIGQFKVISTPQGSYMTYSFLEPSGKIARIARPTDALLESQSALISKARSDFAAFTSAQDSLFPIVNLVYLTFMLPLLLLSLLTGFFLSDEIIRPLVNLDATILRIARGDFNARLSSRPGDETNFLIGSFNKMVQELSRNRQTIKYNERLEAWQEIAQRMAHEIKNPLTPIKLSAQRLLKHFEEERPNFKSTLEDGVSIIVKEVDNLTGLLSEFSNFARMPQPVKEIFLLKPLLLEISLLYQNLADHEKHVDFDFSEVGDTFGLSADRRQIGQVCKNIFQNAVDAMGGQGSIKVQADILSKEQGSTARITIRDSGPGIPDSQLREIFKPYMTTKKTGTGLGLAIVEKIALDHGGEIWCESTNGKGACFIVELPNGIDELSHS